MPFYEIDIYVRTGQAWRNALSTAVDKDFLSLRLGSWAFKAMVLGIPGDRKDWTSGVTQTDTRSRPVSCKSLG